MSVARQSLTLAAINWSVLPLSLLVSVMIARSTGPQGVGAVAVLAAAAGLLGAVGSLGLVDAIVYQYKSRAAAPGELVGVAVVVLVVLGAAGLTAAVLIRNLFIDWFFRGLPPSPSQDLWIVLSVAIAVTDLASGLFATLLIVDDRMRAYSVVRVASRVGQVVLLALLLFGLGLGVTGALVAQLTASLGGLAGSATAWWRRNPGTPITWSWATAKRLLTLGSRQYGLSLLGLLPKRVDVLVIGLFLAAAFNGYYAVAFGVMNLLVEITRSTMWPLVGNMTGQGRDVQHARLAMAIRVQLLLMACITVAAAIAAPFLVSLLYGQDFLPAVGPLRILMAGAFVWAINVPAAAYYNSIGEPGRVLPYACVATALHATLDVLLIPRIGIAGVAVAAASSQVFIAFVYVVLLTRATRLPLREFLVCSVADLQRAFASITHPMRFQTS